MINIIAVIIIKQLLLYHEVTNAKGEKLGKHFHIQYAKK
jgi:hypothetical protein